VKSFGRFFFCSFATRHFRHFYIYFLFFLKEKEENREHLSGKSIGKRTAKVFCTFAAGRVGQRGGEAAKKSSFFTHTKQGGGERQSCNRLTLCFWERCGRVVL
jgi:hypothetical protein